MCGIYGFIGNREFGLSNLQTSINRISHRGPDDQGFKLTNGIGISMCRLAINELQTGKQPFISENERYGVVFNGEIYNYKEISKQLGLSTHTSEAEIILHLFTQKGPEFVKILDGMFAIAIVDFVEEKLFLFRDPFGKKPLWILKNGQNALEFSSEIKAFQNTKTIREEFVSEYLTFGYVPFNKSAYNEVQSVPAGTYAVWEKGNVVFSRYWELTAKQNKDLNYQEAKEETLRLLTAAVQKRLISERPLGVFLSGGYDSSVIAAIMKNISKEEVNSYTIGFKNVAFDESVHARKVSEAIGTNHHEEFLSVDISETVLEVFKNIDLPFADSSILPTFLLNKIASKEIVVALGGDGGDEMFGGYDRYLFTPIFQQYAKYFRLLPRKIPTITDKFLILNRKLERLHQEADAPTGLANRYTSLMSWIKKSELSEITRSENNNFFDTFNLDFESRNVSKLRSMMLSDVNNYLHGDLLVKADLASMFNSLELRSPMLDKQLAQFAYTLPDNFLVKNFRKKIILKDIAHTFIPKNILDRPKMGFGAPIDDWLRKDLLDLMKVTFQKNREILNIWLKMEEIDLLVNRQVEGENFSRILWPVLALALWVENYL